MTLSSYLEIKKINDAEFGRMVGVKRQYIQKYRNGAVPTKAIMERIFEVTGGKVTANDFYGLAA